MNDKLNNTDELPVLEPLMPGEDTPSEPISQYRNHQNTEDKIADIIDYSWGELEFEVSPMNRLMKACAPAPAACEDACYDMDIEPDDIEVSDTVTVVLEIE
ncbi:MAG: hypothetical protein BWZ04_02861 [Firmicutes bacterium ADurb.BinA205]|nr:MAG: hypothetical protein BWZ04_02861 [Firmicutes bacterium ADurb.BinA205]